MKMVERKQLDWNIPDFTKSAYLGTQPLSSDDWTAAVSAAKARQSKAEDGTFRKVPKDPIRQFQCDLKGAIAEVGFGAHLAFLAEANGVHIEKATLVADAPEAKEDINLAGMMFDIKGCAGLIDGLTVRDDKLLIINCHQHDVKYRAYQGYFFVKSFKDYQDVFYFTREEVDTWERTKGIFKAGDYYAKAIPSVN